MFDQTENFSNLLSLMRLQNAYINKVSKIIHAACCDLTMANSTDFLDFITHYLEFVHYHHNSEGYSQAAQMVQVYHYILLERLLDSQVLAAAEQMEMAISHLEKIIREPQVRFNSQMLLLNQGISLIEETQLKIIENLEAILDNSRPLSQLQN